MDRLQAILRRRVRNGASGAHPEAELMQAFVERRATAAEREQVLRHLASCGECAQVAALLTGDAPALPAPAAWWSRVAISAAAAATLAGVLWLFIPRRSPLPGRAVQMTARLASAPPARPAAPVPQAAATAERPAAPHNAAAPAPALPSVAANAAPIAAAPDVPTRPEPAAAVAGSVAAPDNAALPLPTAPPAPQASVSAASGETPPAGIRGTVTDSTGVERAGAVVSATSGDGRTLTATTQVAGEQASGGLASEAQSDSARFVAVPGLTWRLNREGGLERSSDGRASWQPVPGPGGGSYTAVASVESQVWLGGASGALWHSRDGGRNWQRVQPDDATGTLAGDIAHIVITNPQSIVVESAAGVRWASDDGGRTWRRMQ